MVPREAGEGKGPEEMPAPASANPPVRVKPESQGPSAAPMVTTEPRPPPSSTVTSAPEVPTMPIAAVPRSRFSA